jgi:hypothetical protein
MQHTTTTQEWTPEQAAAWAVAPYVAALARMWPERHSTDRHVFADGTVYDRAARRRNIRTNVRAQRSTRAREAAHTTTT